MRTPIFHQNLEFWKTVINSSAKSENNKTTELLSQLAESTISKAVHERAMEILKSHSESVYEEEIVSMKNELDTEKNNVKDMKNNIKNLKDFTIRILLLLTDSAKQTFTERQGILNLSI